MAEQNTVNNQIPTAKFLDSEMFDPEVLDPEILDPVDCPEILDFSGGEILEDNEDTNGSGITGDTIDPITSGRSGRFSKRNQKKRKKQQVETRSSGPAVCVRGAVSLSKRQWEVREQSKAPKVSIKDDIHDIIGRLSASDILQMAHNNFQKMFSTAPLPTPTDESFSTLNYCAQGLLRSERADFIGNFKSIILLIEVVRITHRYVH